MKRLLKVLSLSLLSLSILTAIPVWGQIPDSGDPNLLAMVAGDPDQPYGWDSYRCAYGSGDGDIHILLLNPMNSDGGAPINNVGGFEFMVEFPDMVSILGVQLPPLSINFLAPPQFLVGTNIPVTGPQVLLATIHVLVVDAPATMYYPTYIVPVMERFQSIPGFCAITDANDEFSLHVAMAVEGTYDLPVFTFIPDALLSKSAASPVFPGPCIVPTEARAWGEVKALFN